MKALTLALSLSLLAGCATKQTALEKASQKSDTALTSAGNNVQAADDKLALTPPDVKGAREDLKNAKQNIVDAKDAVTKLKTEASTAIQRVEELEKAFFSPRQTRAAVWFGATLALVGLIIVLLRYGKIGGAVASVPLIGALLIRLKIVKLPGS